MKRKLLLFFLLTIFACGTNKKNEIHAENSAKTKIYTKIPTLQERKTYYQKHFPDAEIVHNKSVQRKGTQSLQLTRKLDLVYDNRDTNMIFFNICDVKADQSGSIYVAEFSGSSTHIKKFDNKGNYMTTSTT